MVLEIVSLQYNKTTNTLLHSQLLVKQQSKLVIMHKQLLHMSIRSNITEL